MDREAIFRSPQTIEYGRGAFNQVGKEASKRGRKALVISDHVMESLGYVSKCQEQLSEENMSSVVYLGVGTEPTDTYVAEGLDLFQQEQCDIIISLGGGSCIDTAKSVAVIATNGGYIGDYMGNKKLATISAVPHLSIPTTAGTGSEATDVTVITNTTNDVKMMVKQPTFLPEVAVVDPLLTTSAPKHVTAATGVDALSHAIEAYLSKRAHPMTDMMALSAMDLIVNNIMEAYEDSENITAKENMSLGALQAGWAFSNSSVCLVHGMSRPIGALFHVPHGFSNAMLLPAVLEYSRDSAIERLADLGRIFDPKAKNQSDEKAADIAVSSVRELCLKLNIPNLLGWGIDQKEFENAVTKMAEDAIESGSPGNNPRVPSHSEIEKLYQVCYDYDFSNDSERIVEV
ncbi:iron-containing alcohol dehydrogenase [Pontibacillus marinus]|uniref:Alcohol dehydrogenase n=1 Tax=Pontibacillus marinus BH030004 = DSM 16465 TaxID=1385511 RepID=A0A0A5GKF6_9BACI|nr:iron-containing alcohol dehydrogenase [Pontibacillus marinus]KGX91713.1 alcohol dehydrogenase [Pontibacillus marinus BH030004 = DSM 16465]